MPTSIACLGRITSILSGILFVCAHSLKLGGGEQGNVFGSLLVFVAHLLLVFAFFGLYTQQGDRNGLVGFFAILLGVIGNIIVTAIVFVEIAQASGEKIDDVFTTSVTEPIYSFGPLLFVIGMILLGVSMISGKVFPAFSGYLLLIGTIVFAAASVSGDSQKMVEVIGSLFTGAGFIAAGIKFKASSEMESSSVRVR